MYTPLYDFGQHALPQGEYGFKGGQQVRPPQPSPPPTAGLQLPPQQETFLFLPPSSTPHHPSISTTNKQHPIADNYASQPFSSIMIPEDNNDFLAFYPMVNVTVTNANNDTQQNVDPNENTPSTLYSNNHTMTASSSTSTITVEPDPKRHRKMLGEREPWTPEEDNLLRLAVQLYGDRTEKWAKIAACVPGRSNKKCRKRWFHSLDPSLRKGAWTEEEDQKLREGVMKYPNQWSKIADMLEGRTDDQCAKRWRESLDPSIDRSEWTTDEDERLLALYQDYGSQWQKIAQHFEGRPGLHCRNRWRKLQRMAQLKKLQQQQLNSNHNDPHPHHASEQQQPHYPPSMVPTSHQHHQHHQHFQHPQQHHQHVLVLEENNHHHHHHLQQQQQQPIDDPYSEHNPYGCAICNTSFAQSNGLFMHMKNAHVDQVQSFDKPYRCAMPNCTKRYKNMNGLQYHLREAKGSSGHRPLSR
ncbi:hypothetical protein K492DRAFT_162879 [Lichtheimia hyalospora FSU 10163]|nr:hypothetical protein K492DRAFT_162879 [Lichtheimia hyalospora FSU 10163]